MLVTGVVLDFIVEFGSKGKDSESARETLTLVLLIYSWSQAFPVDLSFMI